MRQNYQISEQFPSLAEEEALGICLFAQKRYCLLHLPEEELLPILVRNEDSEIVAFWCFYATFDRLQTPLNAPFFTPYFSDYNASSTVLIEIINYCKKKYKLPIICTLDSDLIQMSMETSVRTFQIRNVKLGMRLLVSDKSFGSEMNRKRKSRKLQTLLRDERFSISEVTAHEWNQVYEQNLAWRREKGHQKYISAEGMTRARTQFPKAYYAFQVKNKEECIGSVFFLQVNLNLVYVYSLISAPLFESAEPALLLWNAVYDWAQSRDILVIDMGTSMNPEGGINKELANYKQYIGGQFYRRYTFQC